MAYDEELAGRVRDLVLDEPGLTEKRMFGGLAFLVGGHLAVTVSGRDGLLVRVEPSRTEALVDAPLVSRMQMRGRELDGWLLVDRAALEDDAALGHWVNEGVGYARSLPPKPSKHSAQLSGQ